MERREAAVENGGGQGCQGVSGGEDIGERAAGERPAEQSLGGGVGERHGAVGAEEHDGVLEPLRSGRTRVTCASGRGLDALAETLHPRGETPHVVAGSELDRGVATGEALDPARDSPEVAEEHAPGAEAERDREGEGACAERDAAQQGIAKGLPDEARRHADLHGPEGPIPDADGEPDLVDLRWAQQQARELREPRREHVVEERASRERLSLEGRVAVQQRAPARVDDRAVDDDARIAHEPVEERPEARVLAEGRGTRGARGLQDVGGLVEELAGEEPPLVRRVPEREPRERGKVRGGRDGDHEEDDEREAEQLARAGAQSHGGGQPARTGGFRCHGGRL